MKVAVIFVLLFATVLCRPARKVAQSDSDSSEEVVRRPAIRRQQLVLSKPRQAPEQNVVAAAKAGSDESEDTSDEVEEAPANEAPVEVKAVVALPTADTGSVDSEDSEDSDDDHDDDENEESETDEEEESDSDSESGESSTPAPVTVTPTPGIIEEETTPEYIVPTIVTDPDAGRGDSLGGYPGDYKSIYYVEEKSYHKAPNPYKSYEIVGKKVAYDMTNGNEVEKSPKVYKVKAFQIHSDVVEEDASTPEVETQGLDASSGISQDQNVSPRQAALPAEEENASSGASTTNESESSSTPEEEEEEEGASSPSDSASAESEDEESQSSEEATATPGAADSDSDEDDSVESDSDEEGAGPDNTTDVPVVVTAK